MEKDDFSKDMLWTKTVALEIIGLFEISYLVATHALQNVKIQVAVVILMMVLSLTTTIISIKRPDLASWISSYTFDWPMLFMSIAFYLGSHSKVDPILWILIAFAACLIIGSKYIPTVNRGN